MKRYSKLIIAAIIALIFIGTFVFLWQKSQPKEVVYNEFTPKMEDIQKTTIITGKIEPRNEVNIKPQISGIITDLYKEPGDYVNAGDVIAKVKVIPDMGQLSSAEARVRLSEINLKQAQVNFDRDLIRSSRPCSKPRRRRLPLSMPCRWCATVCRSLMPRLLPPSSVLPSLAESSTSP